LIFRSRSNGTFSDLGDEAGGDITARHVSRGAAFGDFDNDGDLDILIMNRNEPPSLLRNDTIMWVEGVIRLRRSFSLDYAQLK
jgi:enediyne biosynthesis protein E4